MFLSSMVMIIGLILINYKSNDYLEKNKSVSLCSHRYRVFDGFSMRSDDLEIEFDSLDPITVQFSDNDNITCFEHAAPYSGWNA